MIRYINYFCVVNLKKTIKKQSKINKEGKIRLKPLTRYGQINKLEIKKKLFLLSEETLMLLAISTNSTLCINSLIVMLKKCMGYLEFYDSCIAKKPTPKFPLFQRPMANGNNTLISLLLAFLHKFQIQ